MSIPVRHYYITNTYNSFGEYMHHTLEYISRTCIRNLECAVKSYERISVLTAQILEGRNSRMIRILAERANNVFRSNTLNTLLYTTVYFTHNQVSSGRLHMKLILCVLT
jgi:hypothetical protein